VVLYQTKPLFNWLGGTHPYSVKNLISFFEECFKGNFSPVRGDVPRALINKIKTAADKASKRNPMRFEFYNCGSSIRD